MNGTLTVRLDTEVAGALEKESRRTRRTKGQIVRDALKEHLHGSRPNALEALSAFVGTMRGPADLSTNKKHLAGLGRRRRA